MDGAAEREGDRSVRFGTDGIRSTANREALTPERILRLGRVIGMLLRTRPALFRNPLARRLPPRLGSPPASGGSGRVILGRDTRISGDMIGASLAAGLLSTGIDVLDAGTLPTPALAYLSRETGVRLGVMITASHNPYADNGIKLISPEGLKVPDRAERLVEAAFLEESDRPRSPRPAGADLGRMARDPGRVAQYAATLVERYAKRAKWKRLRIVLDCAHGATHEVAQDVFRLLGVDLRVIHARPDGTNINENSGALHPRRLARAVTLARAHAGFAFDGDGDRVVMVDESGRVLDGDHVLAILGRHLHARRQLPGKTVVTTVMCNLGLRYALLEAGIRMVSTPVGDRHVLEAMLRGGYALGGEQSGHILFLDEATTGDGLRTALRLLAVAAEAGQSLGVMSGILKKFPQVLLNVPVTAKPPLEEMVDVRDSIQRAESSLGARGRVLVRYSGTEPIARVMIEGENARAIRDLAEGIAAAIRKRIGA